MSSSHELFHILFVHLILSLKALSNLYISFISSGCLAINGRYCQNVQHFEKFCNPNLVNKAWSRSTQKQRKSKVFTGSLAAAQFMAH